MAAWRRDQNPSLETQAWKTLHIDGHSFLVKGLFTSNSYDILITDFGVIWEESMKEQDISQRSKLYNPLVEAPIFIILQQLSSRLLDSPFKSCSYKVVSDLDSLTIDVEGPLQDTSGPQYQWSFKLTKAPPLMLKHHLVTPLLSTSVELLRRHGELVNIIKKKDKEILDYKENGAVVSRKHLLTVAFDEKTFDNEMIVSKEFREYSLDPVSQLNNTSWQEVYRDIAMCRHWETNKVLNPVTGESSLVSASTGTWEGKLPPSLTDDIPLSSSTHIITSPSKSPRKRPLEESPSKDFERSRRVELEKRLEESKSKNKKKRRRLM